MNRDELGRWGEDLAAQHLEADGMCLLARNWRCAEGEIDIAATEGGRLVVCEVKTRSGTGFGSPAEAVTMTKRRRLRRLAQLFMGQFGHGWVAIRFDVISVLVRPGEEPEITHLVEAF